MTPPQIPSFWEAARVWARIGLLSFGGPAGQIALMHKVLVEERGWIGERRFLHALNYCMLLPGPEAQQLATYVGWLMHRTAGGLLAGLLFVIPGALVMLGLSIAYVLLGATPLAAALFLGVKSAVLAMVVEAVLRVGRRALKTRAAVLIALAAFLALYALRVPFPLVILAAGLFGLVVVGTGTLGANLHKVSDGDMTMGEAVSESLSKGAVGGLATAAATAASTSLTSGGLLGLAVTVAAATGVSYLLSKP